MSTPFFQSALGDPVRMQRRIGWQASAGVPAATFTDFLSNGGPLAPSPTTIERAVIRSGSMRQPAIHSKTDIVGGPLDLGDLDPGNRAFPMFLLSALEKFDTTNPGAGAHFRHRISGAKSSSPTVNLLTLLSDDDLGIPSRWVDVRAAGFTINCQNRSNLRMIVPIAPGKYDYWGAVSQTAGTGSTLPELRHTWSGNWDPTADKDIHIKIIDDSPLQIAMKVGAAATYDGPVLTITAAEWAYLTYLAGAVPLGDRAEQIMIRFPSTPTLVALDEFKILNRRARWTPSFGTARVLAETQARFFIGTEEIVLDEGWTLTHACPGVTTDYAPSTRQPIRTSRTGFQDVTLQVGRRLFDLTLQKPLLNRETLSVVCELKNDSLIGATSIPYGMAFVMPSVSLVGPGFSTDAGGQNRIETMVFQCKEAASAFSYAGLSFTADLEAVVDTDLATIN